VVKKGPDHEDWRKIVFSDETKKGYTDMDHSNWVLNGENRLQVVKDRWAAKIHIWGFIGVGCRHLELLPEGTIGKSEYSAMIKRVLGKKHKEWKQRHIWQQDNASPHREAAAWLKLKGFTVVEWPANSPDLSPIGPDLSPIENMWGILWRNIGKLGRCQDKQEIWNRCAKYWHQELPQTDIDNCILSFRRRLEICVERGGACINGYYR